MQKLSSKVATILNFQSTQKDTFGRSEMKRNQRNQLKQNEIDWYEENGRKKNKRQNEIKKYKKKDNSIS
jgi:hypothetical protein